MMLRAIFFDLFHTLISPNIKPEGAQGYHAIDHGRALLMGLRERGFKTALISNVAHPAIISPLLALVDPEHRFDLILTSGELGYGKPDPRIFRLALQRLGLEPATVVHVGDDPVADVLGALQVGIKPIWFNPNNTQWPYNDFSILSMTTLLQVQEYLMS